MLHRDFILTALRDIGPVLYMAGHGFPFIPGDGLHSTMGDGIMTIGTDGYGFQEMNGALHGYHGDIVMAIMVGLLWPPDSTFP